MYCMWVHTHHLLHHWLLARKCVPITQSDKSKNFGGRILFMYLGKDDEPQTVEQLLPMNWNQSSAKPGVWHQYLPGMM